VSPGAGRAAALRDALVDHAAAIVLTDPTNIAWLCGFDGSNAIVVVDADSMHLCTDGRYATQAPAQAAAHGADLAVVVEPDAVGAAAALLVTGPVALEADHITWAVQRRLAEAVDVELIATNGLVAGLRARKDPDELDRIRRAATITDAALADVIALAGTGCTERALASALDDAIRRHGGSGPAYETIVASGPNAALPHARPTERIIEPGDLVIIDVGCLYRGYRSDMTRTFVVGEPDDRQRHLLEAVLAAQRAGIAAVGPGVSARSIDSVCRSELATVDLADHFIHGTGHGVGLDIHERPAVNSRTDDVLEVGMVVTVEPGVYLPGTGGVRWEDLLVVTPDGAEVLTSSPKPFGVPVALPAGDGGPVQ
jgi:Xaa-Pro aminopeptidase